MRVPQGLLESREGAWTGAGGPRAAPVSIRSGWALPSWWPSHGPSPAIHPWCVSGGPVSGAARSSPTPLMMSLAGCWERGRPWGAASGQGEGHRVTAGAAGPLGVSGIGALQGVGSGGRLLPGQEAFALGSAASRVPPAPRGRPPDSCLPPPAPSACLWLRPVLCAPPSPPGDRSRPPLWVCIPGPGPCVRSGRGAS